MAVITDDHYVRETAIVLLARDWLCGHDYPSAEIALERARVYFDAYEDARHYGDCTHDIVTCNRCVCNEALQEARAVHDD